MPRSAQSAPGARTPQYVARVLEAVPALVLVVDGDGVVTYAAGGLGSPAPRSPEELLGTVLVDFVEESEREAVAELLKATADVADGGTIGPTRISYYDVNGARRTTEVWGVNHLRDKELGGVVVLLLPESAYDRFDGVLMDIVAGASLEQTFGELSQALRYPPVVAESFFLMPSQDDRGLLRAPNLAQVPGPPGPGPWDEAFGEGAAEVVVPVSKLAPGLRESAKREGFTTVGCYPIHPGAEGRADGCLVVWSRAGSPLLWNARSAIQRAAVIAALAISHYSSEAGLRDAAYRDPLTGLGNRRSFFEALEARVAAGDQPAVLYIDLDGFKAVNDSLGHLAGDAVLRVAARRLYSVMRPTDELARLGGDEFAVLCSGTVSVDQMGAIADRIVQQLSLPLSVGDGQTVHTGASVGIALGLPIGTPADTILSHADRALYAAKAQGRGRWAFADPRSDGT